MNGLRKALFGMLVGISLGAHLAHGEEPRNAAGTPCVCQENAKVKKRPSLKGEENKLESYLCPVYPVLDYGDYILYYCDFFETTCGVDPQPTYAGTETPWAWPWQDCQLDCHPLVRTGAPFDGLDARVPFNYMHTGKFPEGTNLSRVRVSSRRNNHFVELPVSEGGAVVKKYAKLLEFEIPRGNFQAPGGLEIISRFVAFEVAGGDPRSMGGDVVEAQEPIKKLPGEHAYSAQVSLGLGSKSTALILLAK